MSKVKFSEPLLHLHITGLNPLKQDTYAFFRKALLMSALLITVVSVTLELVSNFTHFSTITRASETVFPLYQIIWKLITLTIHKNDVVDVITRSKNFWPLDEFGNNYTKSRHTKHAFVKKMYLLYRLAILTTLPMYVYTLLVSDQPMILSFGENEGLSSEIRLFYKILHSILLITVVNFVLGFDGLFLYLIVHVLTELKMVSVAFSQSKIATDWNYKERFEISIKHHIFALDYVKRLDKIYSICMLHFLMASLFALCFGLYLLTQNGIPPDYDLLSKYLPYVVSYLVQVWMFSFAGDLISAWSLEISNQLFYEDWLLDNAYKFKIDKIIILKRAQTPARLTLGGFGNLDMTTFTLVVNNALSFFMFVNAVTT